MPTYIPDHELQKKYTSEFIKHGEFNARAQRHLDDLKFLESQPYNTPYRDDSLIEHRRRYAEARGMAERHRYNGESLLQHHHGVNDIKIQKLHDTLNEFKAKHSHAESQLAAAEQRFTECSLRLKKTEAKLLETSEAKSRYADIVHKVLKALGLSDTSDPNSIHERISDLYANYRRSVRFHDQINTLTGHHDKIGTEPDYDHIFKLFQHYHSETDKLSHEIARITAERDVHARAIEKHAQRVIDIRRKHNDVVLGLKENQQIRDDRRVEHMADTLVPLFSKMKEESDSTHVAKKQANLISPESPRLQTNSPWRGFPNRFRKWAAGF